MNWNDNPKPNAIDKVFVSQTEPWEIGYFVDHYLKTNGYDLTAGNREAVKQANFGHHPRTSPRGVQLRHRRPGRRHRHGSQSPERRSDAQ
jgi:hypothetical protein